MRRFLLALIVVCLTSTAGALDKPAIFSSDKDVKSLITKFRAEMAALIAQAGAEARVTLTHAFQLADAMIANLEVAYANSVKVTFGELDKQQQKAFADTQALLDRLEDSLSKPIEEALEIAKSFEAILADAIFWSKKPIITRYTPYYIGPSSIDKQITVAIFGARLHTAGDKIPKLRIGGDELEATEFTDVSLKFSVPRSMIGTIDKGTSFRQATLTLFRAPEGWAGWLPWAGPESVTYRLLFTVLPEVLGTYETTVTIQEETEDRKPYVSDKVLAYGKGGTFEKEGCFNPPKDFKFDLSKLQIVESRHLANKHNDTSPGTNTGGMHVTKRTPSEICIKAVSSVGCKECGGLTEGYLQIDIVRAIFEERTIRSGIKRLDWRADEPIFLNSKAMRQTIQVQLFDEISRSASLTQRGSLPFVVIEPDPRNNVVFLKPKREWASVSR